MKVRKVIASGLVVAGGLGLASCGVEVGALSQPMPAEPECQPGYQSTPQDTPQDLDWTDLEGPPDDWTPVDTALHGYGRKLEVMFGGRYVEKWLDTTTVPSLAHIRVKNITPADERALLALTGKYRDRFVLVEAKYGGAELDVYRKRIERELARYPNISAANIDGECDLVLIDIDEEPDGLAETILEAGVPADAFAFRPGFSVGVADTG